MAGIAQEDGNTCFLVETLEQEEEILFKNVCRLSTKQKSFKILGFHLSLLSLNIRVESSKNFLLSNSKYFIHGILCSVKIAKYQPFGGYKSGKHWPQSLQCGSTYVYNEAKVSPNPFLPFTRVFEREDSRM